jgi:chromosome partitioning protein
MYDTRNRLSNEVSVQLQQYFSKKVFKTIIPRNIKLAEAPGIRIPSDAVNALIVSIFSEGGQSIIM